MPRSRSARTDQSYVNLRSRLPAIVSELRAQTRKADEDLAEDIVEGARDRVPVRTGGLRDSIHVEVENEGLRVVAGDSDHFYGHIVEFGSARAAAHPFLVPAVEALTPRLSDYYRKRYLNLDPRSSLR